MATTPDVELDLAGTLKVLKSLLLNIDTSTQNRGQYSSVVLQKVIHPRAIKTLEFRFTMSERGM